MTEKRTLALKLFGLADDASAADIQTAYQAKRSEVLTKQQTAPTPALTDKFAELVSKLDSAYAYLSESSAPPQNSRSVPPLSQTKLDDLPGVAPEDLKQLSFASGDVLAGRYTIAELIGQGGMGAVYRAHDQNTGRDIALKVLLPSLLKHSSARERFVAEAKISQQLSHPNIVNVYDVQHQGELFFLTMELLEGQDLRQWLENLKTVNQPVPIDECKRIIGELCDALQYAHEVTVHRDIKPENIWLDQSGRVKLMDFGIARVQSASQRTQTGAAMGTAYYMAPEQLQGRELDARADIYAVGVMLYEMLTGQIPAGRFESAIVLRKEIGKGLSQTIDKALAVNPEQRFSNADELKLAVASGKAGKVAKTKSTNTLPTGEGPNQWLVAVLVLITLLGVGALGYTGVWKDWMPASKAEIAREKAGVAKLQGEIKVIKKRLETARRSLDSDVRDAERNESNDLSALDHWQRLTEAGIFSGNQIPGLEGDLAVGETLLSEGSYSEAQHTLSKVRDGYKTLQQEFNAAEKLHAVETAALAAKDAWLKRQGAYNLPQANEATLATTAESAAKTAQYAASYVAALNDWQTAQKQWQAAYSAVADEVSRIDLERAKAEAERRAKAEPERRAKAEAERRAKAEAERKAALLRSLNITMVSIPGGSFQMGDLSGDGSANEKPVHSVRVPAFKMSQHEITFAAWDACVSAGGCSHRPDDQGWGRGNRPVINVSWNDITQQFIPWLNQLSGKRYRLPSEAEWEYAARAGSSTKYSWGDSIGSNRANCDGCGSQWDDSKTAPVGSFSANRFGLYDMHGNVWEWTQDCWNDRYSGAPTNGSAWTGGNCDSRVLRGGSWYSLQGSLRAANRSFNTVADRGYNLGFRLVQD